MGHGVGMLLGQPNGIPRDKLLGQTKQAMESSPLLCSTSGCCRFCINYRGAAVAATQQSFLQLLALIASDLHECSQRHAAATLAGDQSVP